MRTSSTFYGNPAYVRQITIYALVIAMYLTVMYVTQGFAFGQYQVRIATALYALSAIFPFLVMPLGLANLLSNVLMGGLGLPDMLGGAVAGLTTAGLVYFIRSRGLRDWWIAAPYTALAVSLTIGQVIPGIVGVLLVKQLKTKIRWVS